MPQLPHSLDYIRQVVAEYFADKPVRRVEVFGSYARGEATAESDLDLLLSREPNRSLSLFDLSRCQYELEDALHIPVDLGTAISPVTLPYVKPDLVTMYERQAA